MCKSVKRAFFCWIVVCCFFSQNSMSSVFATVASLISGVNDAIELPAKALVTHEAGGGDKEQFKNKARWLTGTTFLIISFMGAGFIYDKVKEYQDKKEKKEADEKSEKRIVDLQDKLFKAIDENNKQMNLMLPANKAPAKLSAVVAGG